MSNFMGPMAPPPAAPGQPPQLDFQTDPNQRQRFKQFMRQRMQPPMPQMPAPMPQPMPTVPAGSYILPDMDIFAPQQFYDGGIVGGLNNLGEMSGQMVEALNQVVYGGDPMGGGMPSAPSGPPSIGGGGFGGGNMPPPLPPIDNSVNSGPSAINTSDMYGGGFGADNSMTMGTGLAPAPGDVNSAWQAAVKSAQEQRKNGFMGRVQLPGEGRYEDFVKQYNYNLMNPNQQPLTSVGNDGFGSFTQGPLDFLDGSNIAQPTLGGNVGGDNLMGVLPNGGVTSGQMPPGFTPLPPGELGFTENMIGPFEAYAGGSKYFDESTGLYTGPDLNQDPLYKFADGGSVPPRETDIRGMHHELSYITPDEADILEALGGTGELGPMGIPSYRPGGDDVGSENAGSGDHSGGEGSASGANSGGNNDGPGDNSNDGYDPGDFEITTSPEKVADQFADEDAGLFDNDFGGDSGPGSQDFYNNLVSSVSNKFKDVTGEVPSRLKEIQQEQQYLDSLRNVDIKEVDKQRTMTDEERLGNLFGPSVESGVTLHSKSSAPTNLLGGDILSLVPTEVSDIYSKENMKSYADTRATLNNFAEQSRMQENQLSSLPSGVDFSNEIEDFSLGPIDFDDELDVTAPEVLGMTNQDTEEASDYVGGAKVGPRFGTATGPGRLSTVTAEEMEALRTGNAVQRQMYRQLAGVKSAGPVLSSFDPNNVKDPNILDSIFGLTNKPSSAVEVFRAPITEQKGFKSVNTGTFKDGIAGVTGEGNMPGVIGGIMQMFGIDPIVYTGDNRFDPNRPPDDFGGGDDNVLLPLPPEEEVPASTTPNQIGGIGTPGSPIAAGPVLVPSNRTSAPFSGQMPVGYGTPQTGQINPYSLSEMQRYQQMLARLGQAKSPIGLADGGSVLDAAAGRFLESLTAA